MIELFIHSGLCGIIIVTMTVINTVRILLPLDFPHPMWFMLPLVVGIFGTWLGYADVSQYQYFPGGEEPVILEMGFKQARSSLYLGAMCSGGLFILNFMLERGRKG
ncbi:hypothetical protein P3T73_15245 [Kiritimatiellota bacterium B12222]|nr:hypothetical protein P3T73_15245 [Kiritimatiellota bacterium B12222]